MGDSMLQPLDVNTKFIDQLHLKVHKQTKQFKT